MNSFCCNAPLQAYVKTPLITTQLCSKCGSLWADHKPVELTADKAWHSPGLTPKFLDALHKRRVIQAKEIVTKFRQPLSQGKALDYACGQGVFLETALAEGVDIYGCDYHTAVVDQDKVANKRVQQLHKPWGWPDLGTDFKSMLLLDVLEHIERPDKFLSALPGHGIRNLIVKIPLFSGPGGVASRAAAAAGKPKLLESMLLAGDAAPHLSYFTAEGLKNLAARSGFKWKDTLVLPEMGREIVDRARSIGVTKSPIARLALQSAGLVVEGVGRVWSDTAVFLFEAADQKSK